MDITPATFAVLLTASGAAIGAAIIQQAISFIKGAGVSFIVGREKLAAFIGSIVIVIIAASIGLSETPPRYDTTTVTDIIIFGVGLLLAIYNIGRLSMAIHDDRTNDSSASIRNATGWTRSVVGYEEQV
jgi:hypothetical protein